MQPPKVASTPEAESYPDAPVPQPDTSDEAAAGAASSAGAGKASDAAADKTSSDQTAAEKAADRTADESPDAAEVTDVVASTASPGTSRCWPPASTGPPI